MSELKRIFLSGGTGFFGKSILSMLRRNFMPETDFVILSRNPQQFLAQCPEFGGLPHVTFVRGDVRDFEFPSGRFDAVIHAATPAVTTLAPGEMRSIILDGTRRMIEFARQCEARKLMMTSSGAVYGVQPPELAGFPEDFPCHPISEYGIAKLEAEKMCLDSGIFTLLPRCFAFVGPYLNREIHFAIGNFIRDAKENRPIEINGDGMPFRSYLYADDLVEWLFAILERGEAGSVYNVGSDEAVSIADLAQRVRRVLGSTSEIVIHGTPVPGTLPPRYVPDITRAKKLGLSVTVPLDEAIENSK